MRSEDSSQELISSSSSDKTDKKPAQVEVETESEKQRESLEISSSNSLPDHYKVDATDKFGRYLFETKQQKADKSRKRFDELHENLSKHWICLLPEKGTEFEDGMPNF